MDESDGQKGATRGGGKGAAAKAAVDDESSRASSATISGKFPRNAIGLDSWANAHLVHSEGPRKDTDFQQSLSLAHGQ